MTESVELHPDARLATGDVVRLTGLSRPTIQNYAKNGLLHGTRLPSGRWSFRYGDVAPLIPRARHHHSEPTA